MKQLKEFENWTDSVIKSTVFEKKDSRDERAIERQRDIVYKAKQAFPEYPESQAIELFLADKLSDIERRDFEQNRIINAQRKENDKLKSNLQGLQAEIDDIEAGGQETDREIARLKQLSGKLQADVEQRRVGGREVNELLAQVEQLKNKPGVTPEQYKEIKDKVEDFSKQKVNSEELKKFENQLNTLAASEAIDKEQIRNLQSAIDLVTTRQEKIGDISNVASKLRDLESKQSEIERVASDNNKQVSDLNQRLETLGATDRADIERASDLLRDLQGTKQELDAKQQELVDFEQNIENRVNQQLAYERERTKKYRENVRKRSKQAATKINALVGKDTDIEQIKKIGQELIDLNKNKGGETVKDIRTKEFDHLYKFPAFRQIHHDIFGIDTAASFYAKMTDENTEKIEQLEAALKKLIDIESVKTNIGSSKVSHLELDRDSEMKESKELFTEDFKSQFNIELPILKSEPKSEIYNKLINRWIEENSEFSEAAREYINIYNLNTFVALAYSLLKRLQVTDKKLENIYFLRALDAHYLPQLMTYLKNLDTVNSIEQSTNPINRELEELEESLDRIIGKDVASWIKR